jgi:branched-chain amino acid transport system substrate-binding protein
MAQALMRFASMAIFALLMAGAADAEAGRIIKIGVLNDASGPYSDNAGPGSVTAAKMAADDFMSKHPLIKVEILSADHQNKADVGASITRRWMEVDKIDAVADVPNSAVALAVNEVLRGTHAALIASSAATSTLTGKFCSPNTIQWTYDTWAISHTIGDYLVRHGGKKWFFIASDNALGSSMVKDASSIVTAGGGTIAGAVNAPLNNSDYSSYLLQADSTNADVIAFATAGGDTVSLIKQAAEFGLRKEGRTFTALLSTINDVHSSGLAAAQDLVIVLAFYWDMNDTTRAWAKRFADKEQGRAPTAFQAGVYSSVLAYLNAAAEADTNDAPSIIKKLEEKPIADELFGEVVVRPDGRATHDMYLFKVKSPEASKASWDMLEKIGVLSGPEAFRPIDQGGCPLLKPRG